MTSQRGASATDALRVTHIVFDFDGGGMESLVAEMAARFSGSSVHVSLITLSGRVGRLGGVTRDRFDQFHVLRPRSGASMLWPRGVARAIRATRADVVHLHSGCWYKGARAARLAGVRRVIYTEHGREHDDPPFQQWLDRRAAAHTDVVVAVSQRLAGYLVEDVGIESRKVITVHNGVNTSLFTPGPASSDLRATLNIPAESFVIGSVGRLEPVKAYDRVLEAVAHVRDALPRPFVVVLIGDGSERQALQEHAQRLGLADVVRLPGWMSNPVDAYRLLDVFVLPSRSEGQSVSLMEAMACGVAPLVTDVGANGEMLGSEFRRLVVDANPGRVVDAIADALRTIATRELGSGTLRDEMRRRAVEHYSSQRMMTEYEQLYRADGRTPPTVPL
jgi:glycosyltransferase involved in cell wall biosynthesis